MGSTSPSAAFERSSAIAIRTLATFRRFREKAIDSSSLSWSPESCARQTGCCRGLVDSPRMQGSRSWPRFWESSSRTRATTKSFLRMSHTPRRLRAINRNPPGTAPLILRAKVLIMHASFKISRRHETILQKQALPIDEPHGVRQRLLVCRRAEKVREADRHRVGEQHAQGRARAGNQALSENRQDRQRPSDTGRDYTRKGCR